MTGSRHGAKFTARAILLLSTMALTGCTVTVATRRTEPAVVSPPSSTPSTTVPPPVVLPVPAGPSPSEQAVAQLRARARSEGWAAGCARSREAFSGSNDTFNGRLVGGAFPASPWPGGSVNDNASDPLFTDSPPALRAAALGYGATHGVARTYHVPNNAPGGLAVNVLDFPSPEAAKAATDLYFHASICAFAASPLRLKTAPTTLAFGTSDTASITWRQGSQMVQATATFFGDQRRAVETLEQVFPALKTA